MIRITKKINYPAPAILTTNGAAATAALIQRVNNGEPHFTCVDFDSKIYGHKEVKDTLIALQDYKCCFCESKIGHISPGDVEHFRPKAGWVQGDESMNKPGYYWLAYDWDNLLLSCQICNQRHKRNFFPLLNPVKRALSHNTNISIENPFFIHPVKDNPEDFITFKEEIPVAKNSNRRGDITINKLGLDRELLNERRREILNKIMVIYGLAKGIPETLPDLKTEARNAIILCHKSSQKDETEYASMLRCFFRNNPIDF